MGTPDNMYGQKVVAVIALKPGHQLLLAPEEEARRGIMGHMKERMASYKLPRSLHVVTSIPRNHMGKVNKKTLLAALDITQD